jgi:hypothetical protein
VEPQEVVAEAVLVVIPRSLQSLLPEAAVAEEMSLGKLLALQAVLVAVAVEMVRQH